MQGLVALATVLAQRSSASLPEACASRALLKAAYRFLDSAGVDPQAMLARRGMVNPASPSCGKAFNI
jgi:hypothetical protein